MRDVLKQRLVGALVIIALGVIFWPVVFVDVERPPMDRTSQVPELPARDQEPLDTPEPLSDVKPASVPGTIALHDSPPGAIDEDAEDLSAHVQQSDSVQAPVQPSLDESGIPIAWVLQVITVSKRDKADELTAQLIDSGYKSYNRPLKRGGKTLYRVYVGPVFEKSRLEQARQAIDKQLGVKTIVARYMP